MITLLPFTSSDFEMFKSWTNSAEELFQFAGPIFTYPVTDDQLKTYLDDTDLLPFKVVLTETGETIGHCELNFKHGNKRISRVLLGRKDLRGQRIGEKIIHLLAQKLFEEPSVEWIDLNTFSWNTGAIKCYEKVGFRINESETEALDVFGKTWTKLNMVLQRDDYFYFITNRTN